MDEYIDSLGELTDFIALDTSSGFWPARTDKLARDKTVFTLLQGLYCLIRISFGCRNAPGTLQPRMDVLIIEIKLQFGPVYLEDMENF